jgi:hypothetical protein
MGLAAALLREKKRAMGALCRNCGDATVALWALCQGHRSPLSAIGQSGVHRVKVARLLAQKERETCTFYDGVECSFPASLCKGARVQSCPIHGEIAHGTDYRDSTGTRRRHRPVSACEVCLLQLPARSRQTMRWPLKTRVCKCCARKAVEAPGSGRRRLGSVVEAAGGRFPSPTMLSPP